MAVTNPAPTPTTKPSTLKIVLTALKVAAGAVLASGEMTSAPSWITQLLGAVVAVLAVLGYGSTSAQLARASTTLRTKVSGTLTVMLVMLVAGTLLVPSCSGAQRAAELNALQNTCGLKDGPDVLEKIGAAALHGEAGLTSLQTILGVGGDVYDCLLALWQAAHETPAASGSAVMASLPDPALAAVRAFRAHHPVHGQ